jgi:hypothetical protein
MSRSETLATLWYVFLDRHVRVPKPYKANVITFFGGHSELFASVGVSFWLVVTTENLTSKPDGHWVLATFLPV